MSAILIPTRLGMPYYTMSIALDGYNYGFRFAWNQREARWYFDISDDQGNTLAAGVKIFANWQLLRGLSDIRLPPGVLMAVDTTSDGSPPGLYDFAIGKRVQLAYLQVSE